MNITNANNYALSSNGVFKWDILGNTDFFIQEFSLPGINIGFEGLMTPGGALTLGGYKVDGTNTTMKLTILLDETLQVWIDIYNKLMEYCKGDMLEGNATLNLYDNNHNYLFAIFLKNAKLVSLSPVDYSVSLTRNEPLKVELSIAFDRIEMIPKN